MDSGGDQAEGTTDGDGNDERASAAAGADSSTGSVYMSERSTCNKLLEKSWQDTDQAFEKLSHVITFKSRGDTTEALAHWQAAMKYREMAATSLKDAMLLLSAVSPTALRAVRLELENAKHLNRVHRIGLGMLMSALDVCLKSES